MKLNQVDLNLFIVFDAVYSERNLTRAARILNITQPAVSNALARLRKAFSDPLFIRSPKEMIPTKLAHDIASNTQQALYLLSNNIQLANQFDPQLAQRTIHLNMIDLAQMHILPKLLPSLNQSAPNIKLQCSYLKRADSINEIAAGLLDFIIDVQLKEYTHLNNHILTSDKYVCAMRSDHPFDKTELSLQDYLDLDHLLVSGRRYGSGLIGYQLKKIGKQRHVKVRMQSHASATSIVQSTNVVWTLPLSFVQNSNFKTYELPFDMPKLVWYLYWHKSANNDSANIWLRKLIISCINQSNISTLY